MSIASGHASVLSPLSRLLLALVAALSLLAVAGCEETITRENYDLIADGMDLIEVEDILGGPGTVQEASGVGISAGGMLEGQGGGGDSKDYLWGDESEGILVKFRDGKVYHKQQFGL